MGHIPGHRCPEGYKWSAMENKCVPSVPGTHPKIPKVEPYESHSKAEKILKLIEYGDLPAPSGGAEYKQWYKGEKVLPGTGMKDPYPKIVRDGLDRYQRGGDKDLDWVWFQSASKKDKEEFEKYLIDTKDPLAMEPGSPTWRYKAFIHKVISNIEKIQGGE
jgi:hypothetical protein